jgi:hypothetical protein
MTNRYRDTNKNVVFLILSKLPPIIKVTPSDGMVDSALIGAEIHKFVQL